MAEPERSTAALLLEGIVLRLQADLLWLEACEQNWLDRKGGTVNNAEKTCILRAIRLCKEYGREAGLVRAVDDFDLNVAEGETLALMGPSGCGKSTLLHLLGGLDRPTSGEVWLAGNRLDKMGERALARMRSTSIGFVFQAFHLMDELTALENIELPALLAGRSPGPRGAGRRNFWSGSDRPSGFVRALGALGGQCQRVAIARALVNQPLVVLADEPRQPRQCGDAGSA